MIPAFRHMGGKARLRRWLVNMFPLSCTRYIEPFAGKGNVYFLARYCLSAQQWILADTDVKFLNALLTANFEDLPERVEKADFAHWKASESDLAYLLEPRITFAGKGYRFGYSGSSGTHVGYSGKSYKPVCMAARLILSDCQIIASDFSPVLDSCGEGDFVYLDPPYYGTNSCYSNIDHEHLVDKLNNAKFRWALSGYENPVYSRLNYTNLFQFERNSEIKSSNTRVRTPVVECLWTNYEPEKEVQLWQQYP